MDQTSTVNYYLFSLIGAILMEEWNSSFVR